MRSAPGRRTRCRWQRRARRRTYLYQLRIKQRKGMELAARGVTLENLEEMGDFPD